MESKELLEILKQAGKLKTTYRHCFLEDKGTVLCLLLVKDTCPLSPMEKTQNRPLVFSRQSYTLPSFLLFESV